ncbi:MAG: AI-2E family transporter [Flavobacteriaceae bacterium]|nr:AI-2E family transporter [Flavobacteriaceae bacterium]
MKTNQIHPNVIRQVFILVCIVLVGGIILDKLLPYLSGVLGALTIYVLFKNPVQKLLHKGWNKTLVSSIFILISTLIVIIPLFLVVYMLSTKIGKAVKNSEETVEALKEQLESLETKYNFNLATNISDNIDSGAVADFVSSSLQGLATETFDVFIALSIMYFLLFFMLVNQKVLKQSIFTYTPMSKDNQRLLGKEIINKVKANAIGIPLVAFLQGVVALIGFWIFGVEDAWFWFVITAVLSIVPFVGTISGILPACLILWADGSTGAAIGLALYGLILVNSSDNLFRLYILKRLSNEHPLITLLGVIIGLPLFGFIGLIFGPLLISVFLLIVKIYKKEYADVNLK